MRRATCAIFCGIGEEQTTSARWRQASKSIHESTQVEICGVKGFPTTASCHLPSRIPYRYPDPGRSLAPMTDEPSRHIFGDPSHKWYCSSPSSLNFL